MNLLKQMSNRGYDTFRNIINLFAAVKVPNMLNPAKTGAHVFWFAPFARVCGKNDLSR